MKLLYRLTVVDEDEAEAQLGCIFAYSMESLLEQQHKIDSIVKDYAEQIAAEPEETEEELGNNSEPLPKEGIEPDEDELLQEDDEDNLKDN